MRVSRLTASIPLLALALFGACDSNARTQLTTLAHADSLRTDSLLSVKNELLDELMTSTRFVNDINGEMAKLKSHPVKLKTQLSNESDLSQIKDERAAVVTKIQELVARLDSSEARLAATRARISTLSRRDKTLSAQVDAYEQTIAGLRSTVEQQKAEYQAIIDKQNAEIASLNQKLDTVTKDNVRLAGERSALTDTVSQLTTEKNTVYYIAGTKDDLERLGVLTEEGHRRFLILGGRTLVPSRALDTTKFTRLDRVRDRSITLPAGDYTIFSRQNPQYATAFASKGGKISGGLRIDQPERFWEPSKFLILVR